MVWAQLFPLGYRWSRHVYVWCRTCHPFLSNCRYFLAFCPYFQSCLLYLSSIYTTLVWVRIHFGMLSLLPSICIFHNCMFFTLDTVIFFFEILGLRVKVMCARVAWSPWPPPLLMSCGLRAILVGIQLTATSLLHNLQPTWVNIQQKMSAKAPQKVNGWRNFLEDHCPSELTHACMHGLG